MPSHNSSLAISSLGYPRSQLSEIKDETKVDISNSRNSSETKTNKLISNLHSSQLQNNPKYGHPQPYQPQAYSQSSMPHTPKPSSVNLTLPLSNHPPPAVLQSNFSSPNASYQSSNMSSPKKLLTPIKNLFSSEKERKKKHGSNLSSLSLSSSIPDRDKDKKDKEKKHKQSKKGAKKKTSENFHTEIKNHDIIDSQKTKTVLSKPEYNHFKGYYQEKPYSLTSKPSAPSGIQAAAAAAAAMTTYKQKKQKSEEGLKPPININASDSSLRSEVFEIKQPNDRTDTKQVSFGDDEDSDDSMSSQFSFIKDRRGGRNTSVKYYKTAKPAQTANTFVDHDFGSDVESDYDYENNGLDDDDGEDDVRYNEFDNDEYHDDVNYNGFDDDDDDGVNYNDFDEEDNDGVIYNGFDDDDKDGIDDNGIDDADELHHNDDEEDHNDNLSHNEPKHGIYDDRHYNGNEEPDDLNSDHGNDLNDDHYGNNLNDGHYGNNLNDGHYGNNLNHDHYENNLNHDHYRNDLNENENTSAGEGQLMKVPVNLHDGYFLPNSHEVQTSDSNKADSRQSNFLGTDLDSMHSGFNFDQYSSEKYHFSDQNSQFSEVDSVVEPQLYTMHPNTGINRSIKDKNKSADLLYISSQPAASNAFKLNNEHDNIIEQKLDRPYQHPLEPNSADDLNDGVYEDDILENYLCFSKSPSLASEHAILSVAESNEDLNAKRLSDDQDGTIVAGDFENPRNSISMLMTMLSKLETKENGDEDQEKTREMEMERTRRKMEGDDEEDSNRTIEESDITPKTDYLDVNTSAGKSSQRTSVLNMMNLLSDLEKLQAAVVQQNNTSLHKAEQNRKSIIDMMSTLAHLESNPKVKRNSINNMLQTISRLELQQPTKERNHNENSEKAKPDSVLSSTTNEIKEVPEKSQAPGNEASSQKHDDFGGRNEIRKNMGAKIPNKPLGLGVDDSNSTTSENEKALHGPKKPTLNNPINRLKSKEKRYSWFGDDERTAFNTPPTRVPDSDFDLEDNEDLLDEINQIPEDFDFDEYVSAKNKPVVSPSQPFFRSNSYNNKPIKAIIDNSFQKNKIEMQNKTVTFYRSNSTGSGSGLLLDVARTRSVSRAASMRLMNLFAEEDEEEEDTGHSRDVTESKLRKQII